jgi:DNA-binding transcriptional MerR regulator
MRKPLSQLPMDFDGEEKDPSPAPDANGSNSQREGQYLASAGVGVRVKAYKNPATASSAEAESAPVAETRPEPVLEVVPAPAAAGKPALKTGPSKRGRKSLKQVSAEADLIEIPADEILFRKQYYTMGEVSEMFKVNQSLLRYWETEFDILQPRKNKKGDRYFRPVDIKNLHLIYHLLRQKKYTIEGAKEFLRNNKKAKERFEVIERLQQIRNFLLEWKTQLSSRVDFQPGLFEHIDDHRRDVDMTCSLIGRRDGLFLQVERGLLVTVEFIPVPSKHIFSDDIEVLPAGKVQMGLDRTIVIEDINPPGGIIQIDEPIAIADRGGIGNRVEQLAKIGGLVHQRSIIGDPLEPAIQLVEDPHIVIIGKPHGLSLQDILRAEIDTIDNIEEAIQFDDGRKVAVVNQDLQRIGNVDRPDPAVSPDIVEDCQRISPRT